MTRAVTFLIDRLGISKKWKFFFVSTAYINYYNDYIIIYYLMIKYLIYFYLYKYRTFFFYKGLVFSLVKIKPSRFGFIINCFVYDVFFIKMMKNFLYFFKGKIIPFYKKKKLKWKLRKKQRETYFLIRFKRKRKKNVRLIRNFVIFFKKVYENFFFYKKRKSKINFFFSRKYINFLKFLYHFRNGLYVEDGTIYNIFRRFLSLQFIRNLRLKKKYFYVYKNIFFFRKKLITNYLRYYRIFFGRINPKEHLLTYAQYGLWMRKQNNSKFKRQFFKFTTLWKLRHKLSFFFFKRFFKMKLLIFFFSNFFLKKKRSNNKSFKINYTNIFVNFKFFNFLVYLYYNNMFKYEKLALSKFYKDYKYFVILKWFIFFFKNIFYVKKKETLVNNKKKLYWKNFLLKNQFFFKKKFSKLLFNVKVLKKFFFSKKYLYKKFFLSNFFIKIFFHKFNVFIKILNSLKNLNKKYLILANKNRVKLNINIIFFLYKSVIFKFLKNLDFFLQVFFFYKGIIFLKKKLFIKIFFFKKIFNNLYFFFKKYVCKNDSFLKKKNIYKFIYIFFFIVLKFLKFFKFFKIVLYQVIQKLKKKIFLKKILKKNKFLNSEILVVDRNKQMLYVHKKRKKIINFLKRFIIFFFHLFFKWSWYRFIFFFFKKMYLRIYKNINNLFLQKVQNILLKHKKTFLQWSIFTYPLSVKTMSLSILMVLFKWKLNRKFTLNQTIWPFLKYLKRRRKYIFLKGFFFLGVGRFTSRQRSSTFMYNFGKNTYSLYKNRLFYLKSTYVTRFGKCGFHLWINLTDKLVKNVFNKIYKITIL